MATSLVGTTPAQAADIMRQALGTGFDPLKLAALRQERLGEAQDRYANDLRVGDPNDALGTAYNIGDLEKDLREDPSTGAAAHQRVADTQSALDTAALTNRQEIGDAANTTAKRNAFATFLQAKAPYQAETSPEGEQALNEASGRKMMETAAAFGLNPAKNKLSAEGTKTVSALHQAVDLGNKLHTLLTDPKSGLTEAANPEAAAQEGYIGQAEDSAKAALKRWAYSKGIIQAPSGYDEATQLADWMKVLATRGLLGGVRNIEWINQIQDHLAQGRLPPAANLKRLQLFLKNAPDLERDVYDVEQGHRRLPPAEAPSGAAPGATGVPHAAAGPTVNPSDLYQQYLSRRQ